MDLQITMGGPRLKKIAIYSKFPAKPYNQLTSNLKHLGYFMYLLYTVGLI